ncbi:MAG TPA: hypothetical protein VEI82_14110 [Myxococcota bacterium]|nr:hypothetical protein [Myxococcota bacterium]
MSARWLRSAVGLAAALALALGCGFRELHLQLAGGDADARRGPLGEIPPMRFELRELEDARPDPARVGYEKDAYGTKMSDVLSAAPVPQLFRDAIAAELRANGHSIDPQGRLRIEGAVDLFWVEMQPSQGLMAVATAACTLRVVERASGAPIYAQQYTGQYTHPGAYPGEGAYAEALRVALQRMAWEIALDPRLVALLRARSG